MQFRFIFPRFLRRFFSKDILGSPKGGQIVSNFDACKDLLTHGRKREITVKVDLALKESYLALTYCTQRQGCAVVVKQQVSSASPLQETFDLFGSIGGSSINQSLIDGLISCSDCGNQLMFPFNDESLPMTAGELLNGRRRKLSELGPRRNRVEQALPQTQRGGHPFMVPGQGTLSRFRHGTARSAHVDRPTSDSNGVPAS